MTENISQLSEHEAIAAPVEPASASTERWDFINGWEVAPQANDRAQALGIGPNNDANQAARRSTTRRRLQASFKEWSRGRRD